MSNQSNIQFDPPGFGWVRDLPNPNDYNLSTIARTGRFLHSVTDRAVDKGPIQPDADFGRFFPEPERQPKNENSSAAYACASIFEYFYQRINGYEMKLSKPFIFHNAQRYQRHYSELGVSIRDVLKTIKRFGAPPDRFFDSKPAGLDDPFLYGFKSFFENFEYFRLDDLESPLVPLNLLKAFLDSDIPVVLGLSVPSGMKQDGLFPYLPKTNSIIGGQCVVAVGFDDNANFYGQIPKGAVLVRNSWGTDWGEEGFGWVPYRYFEKGFVADCWVVLDEAWLNRPTEDPIEISKRLVQEIFRTRSMEMFAK